MFEDEKFHIHLNRSALCHASGGIFINFEEAAGMNPANCCDDCKRRFRNITGIDCNKKLIEKSVLRSKTITN